MTYELDLTQVKLPKIRGTEEETYEVLGVKHWRELEDITVKGVGSIFQIPMDKSYREIEGKQIVIIPASSSKDKSCWVAVLDLDYLLERLYRNYIVIHAMDAEAAMDFFSQAAEWGEKKALIEKEYKSRELAKKWVELNGGDEETVYQMLMSSKKKEVAEHETNETNGSKELTPARAKRGK